MKTFPRPLESWPEISDLCRYFSEYSPQPMVAVEGLTHIVRYINPAFSQLVGRDGSDLLGRPFCDISPEGRNKCCFELIDRVYHTGQSEVLAEQEQLLKPGSFWTYSCWAIYGTGENPTGVMIQITDSTEGVAFRKRLAEMNQSLLVSSIHQHELTETAENLNQALQKATEAKNQFLATMSHEIRTPLNAIMGFSELMSLPDQTASDRKDYGERIKRHAKLLLRLIDDILDLSKVEAGKLEIEKNVVDLSELMSDIQMVMGHFAEEKGIVFAMSAETSLPGTILSDGSRLKQILTNIIGNAIKFTSSGSVSLSTRVDHSLQKLRFLVRDTGQGMTADQASRIFQPFTQGDSATTRSFGGTGLGLELSRRLARALGGDVTLVDSWPGVGTSCEIMIALEGASYEARYLSSEKAQKKESIRLDGISVLLADDAPDNQFLVSRFLTLAGAHIAVASDGLEAVAMALEDDYDIILMDIQMPHLDGYQATSRLRELGCKVPIVALTAHAMRDEIDKTRLAGCDAHLSKPIGMQTLLELVHRLVIVPSLPDERHDDFQGEAVH